MTSFLKLILFFILLVSYSPNSSSGQESTIEKPIQIGIQTVFIKQKLYLAINYENAPKWHTYWKNPGDAGIALKNEFQINNKKIKLIEEEWPAPKRFIENLEQWAYGYSGALTLFYQLNQRDLLKIKNQTIDLHATWLACKNLCIPGEKKIAFKLIKNQVEVNFNSTDLLPPLSEAELKNRFQLIPPIRPVPDYLVIKLLKGPKEKNLILQYQVQINPGDFNLNDNNLLYIFPTPPFDFLHESIHSNKNNLTGEVFINWDGEYQSPPEALSVDGQFKSPYTLSFLFNDPILKKFIVIKKTFKQFEINKTETFLPAPTAPEILPKMTNHQTTVIKVPTKAFYYYLLMAFIGGLILNVMPCVLPVISLKLFGLLKHKHKPRKKIIQHNFFYTLGILFSFTVLAAIITLLRSIGKEVGWGFQLQSPHFVAIMSIILFIFSLNMFGLFEFITPGGKKLGNIKIEDNFMGDFFSGILATILATPCSAPFLGTALTFAFTTDSSSIFLIFIMIGLGLSFPFIITALIPNLVSFIPRPGKWMNTVKQFLGISLLLTVLWLLDVYRTLVEGSFNLLKLYAVLILILVGIILFKRKVIAHIFLFLFSFLLFINLSTTTISTQKSDPTILLNNKNADGLNWESWSYQKMKDYQDQHQVVFMDFTAKWCFTCKINEKLVLETNEFKIFAKTHQLKLLIGDWTKKDEAIGNFLRENGLFGVPAYFLIKKDGTLINFGETITIDQIKKNL